MTKPDKERADRLAAALRENLRKRKAQAREADAAPAKAGSLGKKDAAADKPS
jgi:hypothetical protein